jgi:hypothetical protein
MSEREMLIADTLDEMGLYETMDLFGVRVTRDDTEVYVIDGERLCFMQAYDRVVAAAR